LRSGPGVQSGFLETPRTRFGGVFLASLADRVPVGRSRGFDASGPTPVRGCGCRSRAARLTVPERLPGRHGPARALPSRSAGRGRERRAVVRAVCRGVSGDDLVERSLLGAATLVAAAWCRAGMRPEAGPRGKSAECSDHGQSGGWTGVVISRRHPSNACGSIVGRPILRNTADVAAQYLEKTGDIG